MRVLFLAPQPFFQDRGTPIAVRLALQVIADRNVDTIDLLTYHEGKDFPIPGVMSHRIWMPFVSNIGPGISIKKLICDFVFLFHALYLVIKARKEGGYQLIHAVEESVFIAWLVRKVFKIPYIYDMDSSLAMQVSEKWRFCKPIQPLLNALERIAVQGSLAVVPVCDALEVIAQKHGASDTQILRDISLLNMSDTELKDSSIRSEVSVADDALVIMYIGNLEGYQGIDLLLDAMATIKDLADKEQVQCIIIGGSKEHIQQYSNKVSRDGTDHIVSFAGPRPVETLNMYLSQADILVSPRSQGNNTPMKIYSYLHSGIPIVATRLPTHTQVMSDDTAVLTDATAAGYAKGLQMLIEDPQLRSRIGNAAHALAEEKYTFEIFSRDLNALYDRVCNRILPECEHISATTQDHKETETGSIQKSVAKS